MQSRCNSAISSSNLPARMLRSRESRILPSHSSRVLPTATAPGTPGNDDTIKVYEDYDGVLDTDGCHDSSTGDTDGDLFSDEREGTLGTDPFRACAATPTPNDEPIDPYPLDINDDGYIDLIGDITVVAGHFGETQTPSNVRYDLDLSGSIDVIGDIVLIANRFGQPCVPPS